MFSRFDYFHYAIEVFLQLSLRHAITIAAITPIFAAFGHFHDIFATPCAAAFGQRR
jgi:hypothetical protein